MSLARQLIKSTMSGLLPRDRFLLRGPTSKSRVRLRLEIALTFDDGPHPQWTPAVLDALAAAEWKGTFFVIGERAAQNPELVRRIVEEGHAIGNHTYTHSEPSRTSARQFADELQQTSELITELTGTQTLLMRPPKGKLDFGKLCRLWKHGQSVILWNVDPKDFEMMGEEAARNWAATYEPQQGDVILMHDRLPYAATIVHQLAERLRDRVSSVPIADWLPAAHVMVPSLNGATSQC